MPTFLKMKNGLIENSEASEISEILFRNFLFPSFRFCPIAKIKNPDLKISEKNLRVSEIPSFPSFQPDHYDLYKTFIWTFLYKFNIIILYENVNLNTANMGWQNMQRLKIQIAKAKRKRACKGKMSTMIPNISKWK